MGALQLTVEWLQAGGSPRFPSTPKQRVGLVKVSSVINPGTGAVRVGIWMAAIAGVCLAPGGLGADSDLARATDTILVTSDHGEKALATTPAAVSVVSGDDLRQLNVDRLDDIHGLVPGLTVSKNDGAGRVVAIRGVGWETAQNLSTQPGVLLYVDGVYVVNPLAVGIDLESIGRVEVFRGPQGTRFGQSAIGGAIHLVTKAPQINHPSTAASLALGSYHRLDAGVATNLAPSPELALRLSGRWLQRNGYAEIHNAALRGFDLDEADSLTGRLGLRWEPAPNWSFTLSGWAYATDHHGAAQRHIEDPSGDPRRLTQDFPSHFELDSRRAAATIDWTATDSVLVQSISSWQRLYKSQSVDGDRLTEDLTAVDLTGFGPASFDLLPIWDNNSRAVSQELSVIGAGGEVDWVAGIYLLDHRNENFFVELIGPAPMSQFAAQIAAPGPDTLPPFQTPLEFVEDRTVDRADGAVYGQTSLPLRPSLELTLGGRWQRDRARDRTTQFWFIDSKQRIEDSHLTWRLGLAKTLGDSHLVFGSIASGWRNGGLNPGALIGGALDVPPVFEPEEVTTVELGYRGSPLDRAQVAVIAFASDYRNYQFIQEDPVPFSAGTGNIPEVTIRGLEAEVGWPISARLELAASAAWLDGSIDTPISTLDVVDFLHSGIGRFTPDAVQQRAALRANLDDNLPPKVPDVTARVSLVHRQPTVNEGMVISRLDLMHRGEYQYRVFNNSLTDTVPDYTIATLSAGYRPASDRWRAELTISNLVDRDGVNSRFTNPFGLHTTSEELIPPREIVTRLSLNL